MNRPRLLVVLWVWLALGPLWAAEKPEAKAGKRYRVAILPFESGKTKEGEQELGSQVADLLAGVLGTADNLELVQRAELEKVLREHSLNLTGVADPAQQLQMGKLVGAQFLVTGRMFPLDRDLALVGKLTSVETSKMVALVVQGPLSEKLAPLVQKLADQVKTAIQNKAEALLPAADGTPDAAESIRQALEKNRGQGPRLNQLPQVVVQILETHRAAQPARVDPAAATEFLSLLKDCRFSVADANAQDRTLAEWARKFLADSDIKPPLGKVQGDVLLVGEGFSEFGTRMGDLVTCVARLEVQAVDVQTGKVLAIGRRTTRATDLAEGVAAKSALERAAREIAVKLIPEAVQAWREAGAAEDERKGEEKKAEEKK